MSEHEQLVMNRTGASTFAGATNYAGAVTQSDARTDRYLDLLGYDRVDVTVEVVGVGTITEVSIAVRSTARECPDLAEDSHWSRMNRVAELDASTGVESSVPLVETIAISATGRHTITLPVTNRYVSAVVWADVASQATGRVYMYARKTR